MGNTWGRQVVVALTNKSGGAVVAGDVVIIGSANDAAFTTTTTGQYEGTVGIVQESLAADAVGRVLIAGYAALVNVPAAVTRQHYIETHTVAKQATGSATRRAGSLGQFLSGGTTPTAILWGQTDQTPAGLGAWTDYTPTWTASSVNPTLNSGTLVGRYKALDSKTYVVQIHLTFAADTAAGTGSYMFSLPSGLTSISTRRQIVSAGVLDASVGWYAGDAFVAPSDTKFDTIIAADSTGTRQVGSALPVTWAVSDQIFIGGIIEVA